MRPLENGDPRSVGRNQILARIDVGGMAIVYLGRSVGGRAVAVKVMHAEFANDADYREWFRREVAATRAAGGRYSPGVLDADPDAPLPWLAMEFLPAVSLREAVRRHGPFPGDAVWPLAASLAEALASIHDAGVLHLDVKPGNVLLTEDGPRVIDFGIAGGVRTGSTTHSAGSPGFMAPEQLSGAAVGRASDVYSCGATLAYALTGTPRLDPEHTPDTALRGLIASCLETDPAARPTVPDLVSTLRDTTHVAMSPTLPAAVLAEIHQRASAAENPSIAARAEPAPVPVMRRRTLLMAGGAACVAGGVLTMLALARDEEVPGTARSGAPARPTTTTPSVTPISESDNRTLEIIVEGRATLYTLTTTVNGQAKTVRNVALPWRRVVEIPAWPRRSSWRIDYHHSPGSFNYQILVDGQAYTFGEGSTSSTDVRDFDRGTV